MNAHAYAPTITETARNLAAERKARLRRIEKATKPMAIAPPVIPAAPATSPIPEAEKGFWWTLVRLRDDERQSMSAHPAHRLMDKTWHPRIADIIRLVSCETGVPIHDIIAHSHMSRFVLSRHVAMYLARVATSHSYPVIAQRFDGRDHTTVLYAAHKIARLVRAGDATTVAIVSACTAELRARGYRISDERLMAP